MSESDAVWREIANLKRRLAELEAMEYKGRAVHADEADDADTVDSLHAATSGADAHVLATDASGATQLDGILTLLAALAWTRSGSGARIVHIPLKQTTANTATSVFRITTPDAPSGSFDAGSWACLVLSTATRGGSNISTAQAGMMHLCGFARAIDAPGTTGVTSAVVEIAQSASAATHSATRDLTDVTVTTTEIDEYTVDVQFKIDISGSNAQNPYVTCWVLLVWGVFGAPPTITAL